MNLDELQRKGIPTSKDLVELRAVSRDLWPRDTLRVALGESMDLPFAICWPANHDEVQIAIDWATNNGIPVVPYGAGSGVCGAATGQPTSLVIDTKRMNRILEINKSERTVRVQTGMIGQLMEDELERTGWMTAHSPSSIMCSTVGGYAAARGAGQFSSRHGVFADMLLGLRMASPTGEIRAGVWTPDGEHDLLPLLCGSEGGLGVMTEALIRIVPIPEVRWFRGFLMPSISAGWEAMRSIMQADLRPSVLRLYDPIDTLIAGSKKHKHEPNLDQNTPGPHPPPSVDPKGPRLNRHLLQVPLAMPGVVNSLSRFLARKSQLIVGFEGSEKEVQRAAEIALPLLESGKSLGEGPGLHWYQNRHKVSHKLSPMFSSGVWADTMEVAAPWSRLDQLHTEVRAALGKHALVMAHFSHAYPEGCSIYFSFTGPGNLESYDSAWKAGLDAALNVGGTVTHHHGVGRLKSSAATREAGASIRVWRATKQRLDPNDLMNPGRPLENTQFAATEIAKPTGDIVLSVDALSLMAEVRPEHPIEEIESALNSQGFCLKQHPDAPFTDDTLLSWLQNLQPGQIRPPDCPLFGIQARFEDNVATRIGCAPRSAAGPDLRWSLLQDETVEMVQISIRRLGSQ